MASVGQKGTGAEIAVRRLLHRMGYRYGRHRRDLPGRPDLVFAPAPQGSLRPRLYLRRTPLPQGLAAFQPRRLLEREKSTRTGRET